VSNLIAQLERLQLLLTFYVGLWFSQHVQGPGPLALLAIHP